MKHRYMIHYRDGHTRITFGRYTRSMIVDMYVQELNNYTVTMIEELA